MSRYILSWYKSNTLFRGTVNATASLVKGAGNLVTMVQARTESLAKFVDQTLYVVCWWVPIISALHVLQQNLIYPINYVAWFGENVECCIFALELTVVCLTLQRSLKASLRPACPAEFTGTNLKMLVTQWTTPVLISVIGSRIPIYPLASALRGWGIGCQIHDGALTARGVCQCHREWSWDREALVFIMIGVYVDQQARAITPDYLAVPMVYFLTFIMTLIATFRPIEAMPHHTAIPPIQNRILHIPYGLSYQIIERLRRAFKGGVFSPRLDHRTPLATTLLKIFKVYQNPWVQYVLPTDINHPEIGYVMSDLVNETHIQQALKLCGGLLATSRSDLRRTISVYVPYLARMMSGLSKHTMTIVSQILADVANVEVVKTMQRNLAERYSLLQMKNHNSMDFADWGAVFIKPDQVRCWGLTVREQEIMVNVPDQDWITVRPSKFVKPDELDEQDQGVTRSQIQRLMVEALAVSEL